MFYLLTNFYETSLFRRAHCPLQNGSFLVRNSTARGHGGVATEEPLKFFENSLLGRRLRYAVAV